MTPTNSNGSVPFAPMNTIPTYHELWWSLERRSWASMVLVPADRHASAARHARALAEVGSHLGAAQVSATTVSVLEYGSARDLEELQRSFHMDQRRREPEVAGVAGEARGGLSSEASYPAARRLIIAIPSLIEHPLGIGAARRADAAVISIHLGETPIADVRQTVALIGRDRIAGCLVVR